LAARFRGQLTVGDGSNSAAGELEVRVGDGTRLAALAGLAPPLRLDGTPIAGVLKLTVGNGRTAIESRGLRMGSGLVSGQLSLAHLDGGRRRLEASLDVGDIELARLLDPLLDRRLAAIGVAEAAVSGRQGPWPDEPFDGTVLNRFEGSIRLKARRLLLPDGISLAQPALDITLADGKVEATRIEGACLGGRCSATLRIDKAAAGVELSGSLRVVDGALQAAAGDGAKPRASGTLGGEIKFTGKGTSLRSALSVLKGAGALQLGSASLGTLWPGAIAQAAEAALKAEPDKLPMVVREALAAGLGGGELSLPSTVKLEIADGRLNVLPLTIATPEGRAHGSASLDLRSLALDSEWRLDQKPAGPGDKPALPAVTVSYRGPVASLGRLEPRISSEALERELAVRRMERDVEELERLRKLDEARRREEAERQRRQFEQTPTAPIPVPVAPAAPQPRPAAPG
jgi:hypothetical protein